MLGPHQSPFIQHDLMSQILLLKNYEKFIHAYVKSRGTKDYLKPNGIKTVGEKTGFLNFILKLESWELNLIIGILEIKFKRN